MRKLLSLFLILSLLMVMTDARAAYTPPGGSNNDVQYNNGSSFGGNNGFTYDANGNVAIGTSLAIGTATPLSGTALDVLGGGVAVGTNQTLGAGTINVGTNFYVNGSAISGQPVGSNTQIQYNNNGAFGGAVGFTYTSPGVIAIGTSLAIGTTSAISGSALDILGGGIVVGTTQSKGPGTINVGTNFYVNGATVQGSPAGSTTQLQYNNSGSFGANSGLTYNGSGTVAIGTALAIGTTSPLSGMALDVVGGGVAVGTSQNLGAGTINVGTNFYVNGSSITGTPGGSTTQIQYNNGGVFGGLAINYGNVTNIPQTGYKPVGDDLTAPSDAGGASTRFVNPLAASLGISLTNNYGTDGAVGCDVVDGQVFKNLNPGATGNALYTIAAPGINDGNVNGAGTYLSNVYRPCMQAALTWLSIPSTSKKIVNPSNCTMSIGFNLSGTHPYTFPYYYSGSFATGATASCPITTTGAPIYFWYQLRDGFAGQMTAQVDGGSPVTLTGDTSPSIGSGGYGVAVYRFTGISSGSHTVLITILAGSGGEPFIVPLAIGTVPSSFPSTSPIVFVSGVPKQLNDTNSVTTAAYDTEVASEVSTLGPSGDGLPIYEMNIRSAVNDTTDMSTALLFANAGQIKIANAFTSLISSTIGGTIGTSISPSSGGLGQNASAANGAVSFSSGASSIGTLPIGFGGTSATTPQGALNNLFTTGTVSASSIIPACTKSGDQTPIAAAITTAQSNSSWVEMPNLCSMSSGINLANGTYAMIYGPSNGVTDLNNNYAGEPYLSLNASSISASNQGAAFNMNKIHSLNFKDMNFKATGQSPSITVVSSSGSEGGAGTQNVVEWNNTSAANISVGQGCIIDDSSTCQNAGGISSGNSTISVGTGYTNGNYQVIPLTGGSGTGASATFVNVTLGTATPIDIAGGQNYHVGDVLGIGTSVIGNGSGFSLTVNHVFGTGALSNVYPNGNGANPGTITAGGTGYVTGPYSNVPLTGGSGSGCIASSITVNGGGAVSAVSVPNNCGTGFYVNDVLSASNANLGGSGSGFQYTVATLQPASGQAYTLNHMQNGSGMGNYGCGLCGTFTDAFIADSIFGGGGPAIFGGGTNVLSGGTTGGGGDTQLWQNRFEASSGVWVFGGFSLIESNLFTNSSNRAFSLLLSGANNGSVVGNHFDAFNASPVGFSSDVQIGMPRIVQGSGDSNGLAFVGNSMFSTVSHGCIDMEGGFDDYMDFEGNTCLQNQPAVYFGTEHPAHAIYGIVGPQGFWADIGLPMGVGTDTPLGIGTATLDVEGTSAMHIPQGSTGQRPSSPVEGLLRDNTTLHSLEAYLNGTWISPFTGLNAGAGISTTLIGSTPGAVSSGGTLYIDASYIPNQKSGLILSNDATTPNTVMDISSGAATSDDNTIVMKLGTAYTKSIGSTFTVGSGNGCLDTGSVTTTSWYHFFLIERTDTQVVDILCSLSSWNPTLPNSYTKKQWIGAAETDGSSHFLTFTEEPDGTFFLGTAVHDLSSVSIGTTAANLETLASIPSGVKVNPLARLTVSIGTSTPVYWLVTSPDQPDAAPNANNPSTAAPGATGVGLGTSSAGIYTTDLPSSLVTNSAGQFRFRANTTGETISADTYGWKANFGWPISAQAFVTIGTQYTLPSNWNTASNEVCGIGEGGSGAAGQGGGGGGGATACITNLSDAAGTVEAITIGAGGSATNTTFKASGTLKAAYGATSGGNTGAAGGSTAGSTGSIKYAGGAGGNSGYADGGSGSNQGGGGGGGAAGVFGPGSAGSVGTANGAAGGAGDAGLGGVGGAAGGYQGNGFIGANGVELSAPLGYGSGGGGGAGGGSNYSGGSCGTGANGGTYGAGGGGGGQAGATNCAAGSGNAGLIFLKWLLP